MSDLEIRVLETDADIAAAFPLMRCLRESLVAERFVADVRRQQRDGYVLVGGFTRGNPHAPIVLAGFRESHTLSRGPHLFVDDLVTDPAMQGRGYGTAMIAWLRRESLKRGLPCVWLDSRASAKGFYEQLGFTFNASIPCCIPSTDSGV
jgi:ribosomal protein S18 acetylase RimI-like enzyme